MAFEMVYTKCMDWKYLEVILKFMESELFISITLNKLKRVAEHLTVVFTWLYPLFIFFRFIFPVKLIVNLAIILLASLEWSTWVSFPIGIFPW